MQLICWTSVFIVLCLIFNLNGIPIVKRDVEDLEGGVEEPATPSVTTTTTTTTTITSGVRNNNFGNANGVVRRRQNFYRRIKK